MRMIYELVQNEKGKCMMRKNIFSNIYSEISKVGLVICTLWSFHQKVSDKLRIAGLQRKVREPDRERNGGKVWTWIWEAKGEELESCCC